MPRPASVSNISDSADIHGFFICFMKFPLSLTFVLLVAGCTAQSQSTRSDAPNEESNPSTSSSYIVLTDPPDAILDVMASKYAGENQHWRDEWTRDNSSIPIDGQRTIRLLELACYADVTCHPVEYPLRVATDGRCPAAGPGGPRGTSASTAVQGHVDAAMKDLLLVQKVDAEFDGAATLRRELESHLADRELNARGAAQLAEQALGMVEAGELQGRVRAVCGGSCVGGTCRNGSTRSAS